MAITFWSEYECARPSVLPIKMAVVAVPEEVLPTTRRLVAEPPFRMISAPSVLGVPVMTVCDDATGEVGGLGPAPAPTKSMVFVDAFTVSL